MHKRGQITIFIILGILMIIAVTSLVYIRKIGNTQELKDAQETLNPQYLNIQFVPEFINLCLEKSSVEGIRTVLEQGGYYEYPLDLNLLEFSKEDEIVQLPVYFQQNSVSLPSLDTIQEQAEKATKKEFLSCLNNFESFKKEGLIINAGQPSITVTFNKATLVDLNYALEISDGKNNLTLSQFSAILPFDLPEKYESLNAFLAAQQKNPQYFLVGELSTLAGKEDFKFDFEQQGEAGSEVLLDLVYDEEIDEEPIVLSFALHFDWSEFAAREPTKFDLPKPSLVLKRIPKWDISTAGIHYLQLQAEGADLVYNTDSKSLSLDSKIGLISLNTKDFSNDEYLYYVQVKDQFAQEILAPLIINVNINPGSYPKMNPVEKQTAMVGEPFRHQVEISHQNNDDLIFTDQSYLFDIDTKSGVISFTPKLEHKGLHSVRVDAENQYGKTWQRWELEIK